MRYNFTDQVVAITGPTGSSIAIPIAEAFYDSGAKLIICSRSEERIRETKRIIGGEKCDDRIFAMAADLSQPEQCRKWIEEGAEYFGKIDVLINSAAVQFGDEALEITPETWNQTFNTKTRGYFFTAQAFVKCAIERNRGGSIINIGSVQSDKQNPFRLSYSVANAAVDQMTRSEAAEWGHYGIRVNCVQVGSFPSALRAKAAYDHDEMVKKLPLQRRGDPKEIACLCEFLSSEDAAYITGAKIPIDGGYLLRM